MEIKGDHTIHNNKSTTKDNNTPTGKNKKVLLLPLNNFVRVDL